MRRQSRSAAESLDLGVAHVRECSVARGVVTFQFIGVSSTGESEYSCSAELDAATADVSTSADGLSRPGSARVHSRHAFWFLFCPKIWLPWGVKNAARWLGHGVADKTSTI